VTATFRAGRNEIEWGFDVDDVPIEVLLQFLEPFAGACVPQAAEDVRHVCAWLHASGQIKLRVHFSGYGRLGD